MLWLSTIAAICSIIVAAVSANWYRRSKNKGHLFLACCFLIAGIAFAYLTIKELEPAPSASTARVASR